jgi:glucokinase
LEAFAGGWAITLRARSAALSDPSAGRALLEYAGGNADAITAKTVCTAARAGDPLAQLLMDGVLAALVAGAVSVANSFNPRRLILGGGVMEGMPELVKRIAEGVHRRALAAAETGLRVLPAMLGSDAGVVGGAARVLYGHAMEKRCRTGRSGKANRTG